MARRGRFGRTPRSQPSLTNTLVSIAREMARQEDENIMQAWQGGGLVNGEPVTDEIMLAHWRERLNGVSKDDPLYDTYSAAVDRLEYSIAESKMTARYAQQNASDGDMVRFYMKWAKKTPKNSEFHRQLLRDAGQYMQHQQARTASTTEADKAAAYAKHQTNLDRKYQQPQRALMDMLTNLARSRNLIERDEDLFDMDNRDPGSLQGFIEALQSTSFSYRTQTVEGGRRRTEVVEKAGIAANTIIGDNNLTYGDWVKAQRAIDPDFDGYLTSDYLASVQDRSLEGLREQKRVAMKAGYVTHVEQYQKNAEAVTAQKRLVGNLPLDTQYMDLRQDYQEDIGEAGNNPEYRLERTRSYHAALARLGDDYLTAGDTRSYQQLVDEIEGNAATESKWENITGYGQSINRAEGGNSAEGDIATSAADLARDIEMVDMVRSSKGFYVRGEYNPSTGEFVADKRGSAIGAIDAETFRQGYHDTFEVASATGVRGGLAMVQEAPSDIIATAMVPDGKGGLTQVEGVAGKVIHKWDGQTYTPIYGRQNDAGGWLWSAQPFWNRNTTPDFNDGENGNLLIDLSSVAPQFDATTGKMVGAANDQIWNVKLDPRTGQPVVTMVNGLAAIASTNRSRFADQNGVAGVDFVDPNIAAAYSSSEPQQRMLDYFRAPEGRVANERYNKAYGGYTLATDATGKMVPTYRNEAGYALAGQQGMMAFAMSRDNMSVPDQKERFIRDLTDRTSRPAAIYEMTAPKVAQVPGSFFNTQDVANAQFAREQEMRKSDNYFSRIANMYQPSGQYVVGKAPYVPDAKPGSTMPQLIIPTSLRVPGAPGSGVQGPPAPAYSPPAPSYTPPSYSPPGNSYVPPTSTNPRPL